MNSLRVHSAKTIDEALAVLSERRGSARVIAGGTDLMVLFNAHQFDPAVNDLVDIWRLDALRTIEDDGSTVKIGALATWSQINRSPLVRDCVPALVAAGRTIGAVQIQNRGTIGGNIVNASPAGDSLPVLAAFDAEIEIRSLHGARRVAFNEFYTGYRKTVLAPDELLVAVHIPKLANGERAVFYKVGTRRAQAISKIVMASRLKVTDGLVEMIAIGLGSVAPTVIRARKTEGLLRGTRLNREILVQAQGEIAREISAITDLRSTEHYRRTVTGRLLRRLLRDEYAI